MAIRPTHVRLRSWKIPQGKIARIIPTFHFCSWRPSPITTPQVPAAVAALRTNFQLPCQGDGYKLLAAALCSAFMSHKENWQAPGGVHAATHVGLISTRVSFLWYSGLPRRRCTWEAHGKGLHGAHSKRARGRRWGEEQAVEKEKKKC